MTLPETFTFSAKSLQSYADCPRRFQLRYVERWRPPTMTATETMDELAYEKRLRQGARLHELAKLSQQGIPHELLKAAIQDENVARWLGEMLSSGLDDLPEKRLPEKRLQTSLNGQRLMAQVDLLAFDPGGDLVVIDWKTGDYVPDRESLRGAGRLSYICMWLLQRDHTWLARHCQPSASAWIMCTWRGTGNASASPIRSGKCKTMRLYCKGRWTRFAPPATFP